MATITEKRIIAEKKIYELMNTLDSTGYNTNAYRDMFSKMSNAEFTKYMEDLRDKPDVNLYFEISSLDDKNGYPNMKKIIGIAKKFNVPLTEYVMFPHTNPDDLDNPSVSATKLPVLVIPIRRLQQFLSKKNKSSADIHQTNLITGQVIGESKSASLNDTQTIALVTTGQLNSVTEFLGPRADDVVSKLQMLKQIEEHGEVSLDNLTIKTSNKQAYSTMNMFLKGALLMPSFKEIHKDKKNEGYQPSED